VYPEDIDTIELKLNQIVEVVGFLDRRTIQGYKETLQGQVSVTTETHCIHAVQLKLLKKLIPVHEETSKLNVLFLCLTSDIFMCNYCNAGKFI